MLSIILYAIQSYNRNEAVELSKYLILNTFYNNIDDIFRTHTYISNAIF